MAAFGWEVYALGAGAALFAGVSKGGFGSGAAFAGVAILALAVPPGAALGIMLPLLMTIDAVTLRPYWRQWLWPEARVLLLGALPGTALGAALYSVAPADLLRLLIGAIAILFVAWRVAGGLGLARARARPLPAWGGALAGLVAGFTSFVSHAGGPPVAVWLLSRRPGKTAYQATTVLVFALINFAKLGPYAALGMIARDSLVAAAWLVPFAVLGAWLGVKAHRRMPERAFFALTYVLLTVTGTKLILDALG